MKLTGPCLALCLLSLPAEAALVLPLCDPDLKGQVPFTCISDGNSGIERGTTWRLLDIAAPEIDARYARCRREQVAGTRTRDRLRVLLSQGYTITYQGRSDERGRQFAKIKLPDGRDVAIQLMSEGLVQAAPPEEGRWCPPLKQ